MASSSDSKTRAGPSWWRRSWPASLTTQPSGARLPRRIARPPRGLDRVRPAGARPPGPRSRPPRAACSPMVRPVTVWRVLVQQAGLLEALGDERDAAGSVEVDGDELPAGLEVAEQRRASTRCGRSRRCRASTPASRATASRCSTPLVEPPLVAMAAIAFSRRLAGDDVRRPLAAGEHVHHELAGTPRRPPPWSASSAGTIAAPIGRDAHHLEGHGHRVGGELARRRRRRPARRRPRAPTAPRRSSCPRRGRPPPRRRPGWSRPGPGSGRARSSRRRASGWARRAAPGPSPCRGWSCRSR